MSDPFQKYLRNPDPERLRNFVVAYTEPVSRIVRRVVGCHGSAEDVVQEVFLRLTESRPPESSVPNPRAYVLRAALNAARAHLRCERARARHEQNAGRLRERTSPSSEELAIARETVERLHRRVDELPEKLRLALHLRVFEDLGYKDIAFILGIRPEVAYKRVQRARNKLRRSSGESQLIAPAASLEAARKRGWLNDAAVSPRPVLQRLQCEAEVTRPLSLSGLLVAFVAALALMVSSYVILRRERTGEAEPRAQLRQTVGGTGADLRPRSRIETETPAARTVKSKHRSRRPGPIHRSVDAVLARSTGTTRSQPGGHPMIVTDTQSLLLSTVMTAGLIAVAAAGEPGDFDGDGRLSIKDYFHLEDGGQPAPGSLESFSDHSCGVDGGEFWNADSARDFAAYALVLETLRRNVPAPMPHFYDIWPRRVLNEPLPARGGAEVTLLPSRAIGDESDRVRIGLELTLRAPARGFVLILDADSDVLRVPLWAKELEDPVASLLPNESRAIDGVSRFDSGSWFWAGRLGECRHPFGDLPVAVTHPAFLVTGGKLVMVYGIREVNGNLALAHHDLSPGDYLIEVEARLPRGTPAGSYNVRVLPGSEFVFLDGSLEAPVIDGPAELTVEREVRVGWDGGVPPLDFDMKNRRVLGGIDMRLVRGDGSVPAAGEPVAEARPGDEFWVGVELRTSVPLNYLRAHFQWPTRALECVEGGVFYSFENPDDGLPYNSGRPRCYEGSSGLRLGETFAAFLLRGGSIDWERPTAYWSRPMEYFRPLDEWVPLADVRLRVALSAQAGEEIPLVFKHEGEHYLPAFAPYAQDLPCALHASGNWSYEEVRYGDSFVRVLEGGDPPPPPVDLGTVVTLGDAQGLPGDLVAVPIIASVEAGPLSYLRLVLGLDPEEVRVERLDVDASGPLSGQWIEPTFPGEWNGVVDAECENLPPADPRADVCRDQPPRPLAILYRGTGPETVFVDIWQQPFAPVIETKPREIGRLQVRILAGGSTTATTIHAKRFQFDNEGLVEDVESGSGTDTGGGRIEFFSARQVEPATITVSGRGFRRGDANSDGRVDLSDAVATLSHLFLGRVEPACADGADADDSGNLEITDAIFLLGVLFLGQGQLPPPHPLCGRDPTTDSLSCRQACPPN